ncbi:MAG: hypothetical protein AAGU32_01235 [Bacillota bacterium]
MNKTLQTRGYLGFAGFHLIKRYAKNTSIRFPASLPVDPPPSIVCGKEDESTAARSSASYHDLAARRLATEKIPGQWIVTMEIVKTQEK